MSEATWHLVEKIAAAISFLAIVFATVQFFDSMTLKKRMTKALEETDKLQKHMTKALEEMGKLQKHMGDVLNSVSSRYIGAFPGNMQEINDVTAKSCQFLLILTDWVGFGSYSSPEAYRDYERHLTTLLTSDHPVRICIVAYSTDRLRKEFENQISREKFEKTEKQTDRFRDYYRKHWGRREKPPETYDDFVDDMVRAEEQQRERLKDHRVEIQTVEEPSLVLLWLRDGVDAVFCFQASGTDTDPSFRTQDMGLVLALGEIFKARWKGALPLGRDQEKTLVAKT
jgi:hypothetical protein